MNGRLVRTVIVAASLSMAAVALMANGNSHTAAATSGSLVGDSAEKRTQIVAEQQVVAERAAMPRAPHNDPVASRSKPQSSCPAVPIQPGGINDNIGQFGHFPQEFANGVTVAGSDGLQYLVLAGTPDRSVSGSGGLMVISYESDICARIASDLPDRSGSTIYPDPTSQGTLKMVGSGGDIVNFTRTSGKAGSFNVVTRQYL